MQSDLLYRILNFDAFDEMASSYFSFFLFKAMGKIGNGHLYLDNLDFWYNFIDRGHTTCGEIGFASTDRSDCHAWSAHPAYFMLSLVCGLKPDDTGFNWILVSPNPGALKGIRASKPHPMGNIDVEYKIVKSKISAIIILPDGISGCREFQGRQVMLKSGSNI